MIRVWPKDSSLDDFVKEKLENDEFWAPAEAFFLKLMKPKSILDRLKVWDFKEKWDIGKETLNHWYDKISTAQSEIEKNKQFMKVIGMTLSIGNIMNGGTPRGRADGFELPILDNLNNVQDSSKQSLLQYILRKLDAQDEDFQDDIKQLVQKVNIRETDMAIFRTKTQEMQALLGQARASYTAIQNAGEGYDKFQEKAEVSVKRGAEEMTKFNENLKQCQEKHTFLCQYYNLEASNDMTTDTKMFFDFFISFFKKLEQNLPAKPKKAIEKAIKQKINPLMQEMKAKLQEQANKKTQDTLKAQGKA